VNADRDLELAYQVLESYGVSRGRAKSVHNGIEVLATRLRKENTVQSAERSDADRFRFWFSLEAKSVDINEYIRGVRDGWNLDQWRSFVDDCMGRNEPASPNHRAGRGETGAANEL